MVKCILTCDSPLDPFSNESVDDDDNDGGGNFLFLPAIHWTLIYLFNPWYKIESRIAPCDFFFFVFFYVLSLLSELD